MRYKVNSNGHIFGHKFCIFSRDSVGTNPLKFALFISLRISVALVRWPKCLFCQANSTFIDVSLYSFCKSEKRYQTGNEVIERRNRRVSLFFWSEITWKFISACFNPQGSFLKTLSKFYFHCDNSTEILNMLLFFFISENAK
jgi:hypothetical protein